MLAVTGNLPYNVRMCVVVVIVNKFVFIQLTYFLFQRFAVQHKYLFSGETKSFVLSNEPHVGG